MNKAIENDWGWVLGVEGQDKRIDNVGAAARLPVVEWGVRYLEQENARLEADNARLERELAEAKAEAKLRLSVHEALQASMRRRSW